MQVMPIWVTVSNGSEWNGDLGAFRETVALEYLAKGILIIGHEARIDLDLLAVALPACSYDFGESRAYAMHVRAATARSGRDQAAAHRVHHPCGRRPCDLPAGSVFGRSIEYVVPREGMTPLKCLLKRNDGFKSHVSIFGLRRSARAGGVHIRARPITVIADGVPQSPPHMKREFRDRKFSDRMAPAARIPGSFGPAPKVLICSLGKMSDGHYQRRDSDCWSRISFSALGNEAFVNGQQQMTASAEMLRLDGWIKRFFAGAHTAHILRLQAVMQARRCLGGSAYLYDLISTLDANIVWVKVLARSSRDYTSEESQVAHPVRGVPSYSTLSIEQPGLAAGGRPYGTGSQHLTGPPRSRSRGRG